MKTKRNRDAFLITLNYTDIQDGFWTVEAPIMYVKEENCSQYFRKQINRR